MLLGFLQGPKVRRNAKGPKCFLYLGLEKALESSFIIFYCMVLYPKYWKNIVLYFVWKFCWKSFGIFGISLFWGSWHVLISDLSFDSCLKHVFWQPWWLCPFETLPRSLTTRAALCTNGRFGHSVASKSPKVKVACTKSEANCRVWLKIYQNSPKNGALATMTMTQHVCLDYDLSLAMLHWGICRFSVESWKWRRQPQVSCRISGVLKAERIPTRSYTRTSYKMFLINAVLSFV